MAEIDLAQTASVSTPSAGNAALFIDSSGTPLLKWTDPAGVTHTALANNIAALITAAMTFGQNQLLINNPAATFAYTIQAAAIAAARTLNLPLITGTDTLAVLGLAQIFSAPQTFTGGATSTSKINGIGFAAGAGGTVTQATSKVTAFTLSAMCGNITFAADALAADTSTAGATWTNTAIAATDIIVFMHISGGTIGAYNCTCNPGAGSATIFLRNLTPGSLSEAPVFRFAVIKAVTA
jgi:hypothetical protein